MVILFILCFSILFSQNAAMLEIKDTLKNKELEFVETLKQDLRRNNDDYAEKQHSHSEARIHTQTPVITSNLEAVRYKIVTTRDNKKVTRKDSILSSKTTPILKVTVNVKEDVRYKIIDNIRRRVYDAFKSKESIKSIEERKPERRALTIFKNGISNGMKLNPAGNPTTIKSLWNEMQKIIQIQHQPMLKGIKFFPNKNMNQLQLPTLTTEANTETKKEETAQKTRKGKKSKMEKFKKFMEKNKELLKEFISSKKQMRLSYVTPQYTTQVSALELNKVMRQAVSAENNLGELPDANLLDMAPAKGSRIQDKRRNGRLCHRHVLVPEGPKYNSQGQVYLAAHGAVRGARPYNATRPPRLLLPRCCNCCRKSVLGCE